MKSFIRLFLGAAFVISAQISHVQGAEEKSQTRAVRMANAEVKTLPQILLVNGAILPWQEAMVSARLSGVPLEEVRAAEGDVVKRGAILARFDDRLLVADKDKANSAEIQARLNWQQAEAEWKRNLALKEAGVISVQKMSQLETQTQLAQAQWQSAKAALRQAEIRLQDAIVVAPDDGVITARSAQIGWVPVNGAELFRLIRKQRLEWRAEWTASQMALLKIGMEARVELADGSIVNGKIRQLSASLDTQNRLGIAYVDLLGVSRAKAGMYVSGQIHLEQSRALMVPAMSVVLRDGRHRVFVVEATDGKNSYRVRQVTVKTGRREAHLLEVVGLKEHEQVVTEGAGFLADGDRVQVVVDAQKAGR